jgi:hypothetical protein
VPPNVVPEAGSKIKAIGGRAYVNPPVLTPVPPVAVIETSAAPGIPGGVTATIMESETTVKEVAGAKPKSTNVAFVKPDPVTVTAVPPDTGPAPGLTEVIAGAGIYAYTAAAVPVPPIAVTATSAFPAVPAGTAAMMEVSETTVKDVAGIPPKVTAATPANPVPVMFTRVPPDTGPAFGLTKVMDGAGI